MRKNTPLVTRFAGAGAVLCASLVLVSCNQDSSAGDDTQASRAPVPAVEVAEARTGVLPLVERLTGTARAAGEVAIYPEISGAVVEVLVENGARVTEGQPLVRIRTAGAGPQLQQAESNLAVTEAQVREIEASLADLRAQLERTMSLAETGLVSRQEVDTLEAQVDAATASLSRARAEVAAAHAVIAERAAVQRQSVVRAPIAGHVGQRAVEVGMRVDPQTPLFVVGQLDEMQVVVPVAQDTLVQLRPDQRAEVIVEPGEPPLTARISRISPFLAPGSFSAEAEIDVQNDGSLVPGMFVTVDVYYGESEPATLVPTSAVYNDPSTGESGVFVASRPPDAALAATGALSADPVDVRFSPVDVRASGRHTVGVAGLEPGAWVVVVGQHLLGSSGGGPTEARVRVVTWDQILELQGLQREDLVQQFIEKQRQTGLRQIERDRPN